jgi:hypothetical protein
MTTMAAHVAAFLLQDATITSYTSTRVYSYDIRLDGPDAHPETKGPYGFQLPTIIVDDRGGLTSPLAPSGTFEDNLAAVIVTAGSATERVKMEALTLRVIQKLHRWREQNTKASLFFANRTGLVADPPPATGAIDTVTFTVAGSFIGVST